MALPTPPIDFMNEPISIDDVKLMHTRPILANERPYTKTVIELNNKKVEDWYNRVLIPLANENKMILPSVATKSWPIYCEGVDVNNAIRDGYLPKGPAKEDFLFWSTFFIKNSVE